MSSHRSRARSAIATVAAGFAECGQRIVFVGGMIPALYPLEGVLDVRPSVDVDCIVDVTTTLEYYAFLVRLRALGFAPCEDKGAPLCRLVFGGIQLDLVATEDTAIGATNSWYHEASVDAATYAVEPNVEVLAITPIYFVATKLEAFRGRGANDYEASHDLEDVLTVVTGLSTLRDQIMNDQTRVAVAVRDELRQLVMTESFVDALPGHFDGDAAGQARAELTLTWLKRLAF